jgi:chromosome segregation ATPase
MDDETRAAFGRMDRWFELNQSQYNDLRQDVAGLHVKMDGLSQEVGGLRQDLQGLRQEFDALRQEFYRFRDWVTAQFAEVRLALQQLTARVDRLDDRRNNPVG